MSLQKLSRAYGTQYAGLNAVLRDSAGTPARLYGLQTGEIPTPNGAVVLDASGGFSTFVDDSRTYKLEIYGPAGSVVLTDFGIEVSPTAAALTPSAPQVVSASSLVPGGTLAPIVSSGGYWFDSLGNVVSLVESTDYISTSSTGTVFTGLCELAGYDVVSVTPGATVTVYDNTSASGVVVVPTTVLNSVGRTEFQWKRVLKLGCHVVISGTATLNVLVG
jgi:hypothetical protein